MVLFASPDEHAENPPDTWRVVKAAERCWHLDTKDGVTLDTFKTRRQAAEAIADGFTRRLYDKESRWYAGENVHPWRPYAEIAAERARRAERLAQLAS